MTEPLYIDPNSGAAPQPGGAVVGGANSQTGQAHEDLIRAIKENPPTSDQEAEAQRQVLVTRAQEDAKQGEEGAREPKKVETPELAEVTIESAVPSEEAEEKDKSKPTKRAKK